MGKSFVDSIRNSFHTNVEITILLLLAIPLFIFIILTKIFQENYFDHNTMNSVISLYTSVLVIAMTYYIYEHHKKESNKFEEIKAVLKENSNKFEEVKRIEIEGGTKLMDQCKFYSSLGNAMEKAREKTLLMYLEPSPPEKQSIRIPEKINYFKNKTKLLRDRPQLNIDQIISIENVDKFEWVKTILEDFKGRKGFNLKYIGWIYDNINNSLRLEKVDGLSVQLIDNEHAFIISVRQARTFNFHQDCWTNDKNIITSLQYYFEETWSNAISLMTDGEVNMQNLDNLTKAIEKRF